ncbi:hypothetical protein CTI12_AA418370 [Artemisia annua]|uniref:Uncharacterized protein n=1 Tax=Artemisia annua TaxID=35608 RepID=A0A2U1M5G5_ARTAN|nr:hypothetical protein CTI12_AA418370 [Artemisia annua]
MVCLNLKANWEVGLFVTVGLKGFRVAGLGTTWEYSKKHGKERPHIENGHKINYQRANNDFGSLCASGNRRSSMTEGKWLQTKAKDLELNGHINTVDRPLGCHNVSCGLTTYSLSRILYYSSY